MTDTVSLIGPCPGCPRLVVWSGRVNTSGGTDYVFGSHMCADAPVASERAGVVGSFPVSAVKEGT